MREVEWVAEGEGRYRVRVDGVEAAVSAERIGPGRLRIETPDGVTIAEVTAAGDRRFVRLGTLDFVVDRDAGGRRRGAAAHGGGLEAPMPGVVTRVLVAAGDAVAQGQPLLALEAMKMEHVIRAPRAGTIKRIAGAVGQMVQGGVALVELEDA